MLEHCLAVEDALSRYGVNLVDSKYFTLGGQIAMAATS